MKYEKPMIINLGKAEDLIAGSYTGGNEQKSDTCVVNGKSVVHTYINPNYL